MPVITWIFQLIADGLYRLESRPATSGPQSTWVYFLVQAEKPDHPDSLEPQDVWVNETLQGWYVFGEVEITRPEAFAAAARGSPDLHLEPSTTQNPRGLVFLADPDTWAAEGTGVVHFAEVQVQGKAPNRVVTTPLVVDWEGGVGIRVDQNVICAWQPAPDSLALRFSTYGGGSQPSFAFTELTGFHPRDSAEWITDLPLTGPQRGALASTLAYDPGRIYEIFGGAFRYGYSDADGIHRVDFPWFPWVRSTTGPAAAIQFQIFAHPLAPLDQNRTRLALDLNGTGQYADNTRKLDAPHLQRRDGESLVFVPVAAHSPPAGSGPAHSFDPLACGFAFTLGPGPSASEKRAALAPVGLYEAAVDADTSIMPGLSGLEYIQTGTPLVAQLNTGQPAEATGFGAGDVANAGELLSAGFTTSSCQIIAGPAGDYDGYYAQPNASTFYADTANDSFHVAVSAQVSALPPTASFPMAPLLGLFPGGAPGPNPQLSGDTLQQFVEQVVTPARYQAIVGHPPPIDSVRGGPSSPTFPRFVSTGSPTVASGTALSPQGLLVDLDENGNWDAVNLARGPVDPDQLLRFTSTGDAPLDTDIVNVMLKSQLVWVISRLQDLKGFTSTIDVGDFNFAPGAINDGAPQPLLIFKYSTAMSLVEIINSPETWTDATRWIGDPGDDDKLAQTASITRVQETLRKCIADADATIGDEIDPFVNFRNTIATDPLWTGIISINTAIDPISMPPDLQMLFAGIEGPLTAHHFGVESSQIGAPPGGSGLEIVKSSLFGVIHYVGRSADAGSADPSEGVAIDGEHGTGASPPPTPPPPFEFEVCDLTVVIANSIVADFHSEIAMKIDELFGRAVTLEGDPTPVQLGEPTTATPSPCGRAPNTMRIAGTYQRHGAVGTVTFETRTPFVFDVDTDGGQLHRVLERISIDDAALTPVTSTKGDSGADDTEPTTKLIRANFGMSGEIDFARQPFPGQAETDAVDIFGYGINGNGLRFSGLALDISFELSSEGKRVGGPATIVFDATSLVPAATPDSIRDGALVKGLPLTLSGFKASADGLSASALGAQSVNLPQAASYSIQSPVYAITYELPLGSLGKQAEVGATISATLVVGWGPTPAVAGNDGVSVLIQLPQATAGVAGFSLQGILKVVFGAANLMRVPYPSPTSTTGVWVVMFNNIQLSLLGVKFPPGVISNFVLFSNPEEPGGSNIAWYLAVAQAGKGGDGEPDRVGSAPALPTRRAVPAGPRSQPVDAQATEVSA